MYRTFHKLQPSPNPALAPKKPNLTKSPKPPNPACAEFVNSVPSSKDEKTLQDGNRQITAKSTAFCSFCAFAEGNAVSLAKTDCKGGQNVGRNDRLWHLKSPDLSKAVSQSPRIPLWHPKSRYLPKAPSQIRTQPAEFQSGNRQTIPEFGVSRILELLHKAVGKTGVTRRKSSHVDRAIASGDILGQLQM